MHINITDLFTTESATVLSAMQQIDRTGKQMLLVTEGSVLKAIITDGDYRRHLLRGGNLHDPVSRIANYSPKYIFAKDRERAKEKMREWGIMALPIVNEQMEVQSVVFANDGEIGRSRVINAPVVIMAGGQGTRLYPYTKVLPKPLIPVGELPITEHIINRFLEYECRDFHLVVNHKKNMIKAYFSELDKPYTLHYHEEEHPLGTGGGLSLLRHLVDVTFFLTNCDILLKVNYKDIYDYHKAQGNIITIVAAYKHFVIPYGVLDLGREGEYAGMTEKPEYSVLTNSGFYIVEPELLGLIADNEAIGFPGLVERAKTQGHRVGVFPVSEASWLDMGQLEELDRMRQELGV